MLHDADSFAQSRGTKPFRQTLRSYMTVPVLEIVRGTIEILEPFCFPRQFASPERYDLNRAVFASQIIFDLNARLPKDNSFVSFVSFVGDLIEVATVLAQEALELLLGNVVCFENSGVHALFERADYDPHSVRLREDSSCILVCALRGSRMWRRIGTEEELRIATDCGLEKSTSIGGQLRDWLAETMRIAGPVVDDHEEVMRGYGGCDAGTASLDCRDGGS